MQMLKIFIASSVHRWNDTRIFQKEATSLAKKYTVNLYITSHFEYKLVNNVNIFGLPSWVKRSDRKLARKRLWDIAQKEKFDIFHFHDPELIPLGLYIKLFKNKKVIYDIHENVSNQILSKPYIRLKLLGKIVSLIYWTIEKVVVRLFDGIIVAGEDILSRYKSKIILNNYPVIKLTSKERTQKKIRSFVYLGGIDRIRGVEEAAIAIQKLNQEYPDNHLGFRVIGSFDNKEYEEYFLHKYNDIIEFLGWRSQVEAYKLVSECIAGIAIYLPVPNHLNLRTNKVFEYMSASIPVIYSNFSDWEYKLNIHKIGFSVDPFNKTQIINRMKQLLDSDKLVSEMGSNGRNAIENIYNWGVEEKKLFELYDKLT